MKNTKRGLSLFLAFALFFGTVAIGLSTGKLGIDLPEAEVLSKADGPGAITFYVPETVYLTPANGNMSTFQYYVDCTTAGVLDTQYNKTSGVVYFNCPGASSVSITAVGASVTLGSSSASGTTLSTTVTAGTLSTAIAEGTTSTITWTASYVVNGVTMTAKAYSVAYAPLVEPVASAIRTKNTDGASDGLKAFLQAFTYVVGIHSVSGGGYGANRSGSKINAPMLGTVTAPGNNGVTDWFNNSQAIKGTTYQNKEGGGNNIVVVLNSPTATITVDRSRYTNISQIPNFRYGLVITDTQHMDDGYWFVSDYTDGPYKANGDESKDGGNLNNWWGTPGSASPGEIKDGSNDTKAGSGNGIKVGGQTGKQMFSKDLTAGTGSQSLVVKGAAKYDNDGEWNATINLVNVSITKVDKATLRSNVRTHINKGLQSADWNGDFSAYEAEIKAAAERLGNPTNSTTSDTLQTKFNALTRKTYSATVEHKFNGNTATITEGPTTFNSGDNVTIGPNSYTGYTISSASGATTATSQTTLNIRRAAVSQTYNYNANSYTLTYNANGGSVSPGSKTVTYDFQYGELATPSREGYTFNGWFTAASGGSQVTASTLVTTAANHTVYAQWTVKYFDLTFNANGGTGGTGPTSTAYGASISAPAVSRTGYTFAGWSPTVPATMPAANSTYTAQWTVNSYDLTFNANGGSGGTGPTATAYGTAISAPTVTRTGYTFTGWNPTVPATMPAANSTYTAQWTINTYKISFDANGGTGTMSDQSIQYGSSANLTANAFVDPTGYSFAGWNTAANGNGTAYNNGASYTMGAANVTLYAQWSANNYTISFDSDGGTAVSDITQAYGTAVTPPTAPTRTGYTFNGWNPAVPATMPAQNVTCVAQWTVNSYDLKFDANGGTGGTGPTATAYGTAISAPTVSRTGYTFTGWNPTVPATMPAANSTYTAQWSVNTYKISFDSNGGTGTMSDQSLQYGSSANLTANAFVAPTGYSFAGWNTAANGNGTAYNNGASYTMGAANVTLYAQWSANNYTISFDSDGGTAVSDITQAYGTAVTPPAAPTRTGYTFNGWNPAVPATIPAQNVTCVAQWTVNSYDLTFNANGGAGGTGLTATAYGTAISAPPR